MNIVLIGPPGAGKGSQAKRLVLQKSFYHLSTGDIFREAIQSGTPLGKTASSYIQQGTLVPDEVTVGLVREVLKTQSNSIIFDGFPRNVFQADALASVLEEKNQKMDAVIFIDASDAVVLKRLTGRRWASKSGRIYHVDYNPPKNPGFCDETKEKLVIRKDDHPEVVSSRLKVFRESTLPLLQYYEKKGVLKRVDGEGSPEEVFQKILKVLEE